MKTENVLILAGAGIGAYWLWQWLFGTTTATPSYDLSPAPATSAAPAASAAPVGVPLVPPAASVVTSTPATPSYSGPSLDSMFKALVTAVFVTKPDGTPLDPAITINAGVISANPDVFNWYLVNRTNANVPDGLLPGGTTPVTMTDYWAAAAPVLKQHFPGLAGGFGRGLGMYAELGRINQMHRGRR